MTVEDRARLRREARERRRSLSSEQQVLASGTLCKKLGDHPLFQQAHSIAMFIAADGEIDLKPLMERCVEAGKHCYLPAIDRDNPELLMFLHYQPGDKLRKTALGVLEPILNPEDENGRSAPQDLDLVLTPLVAFDSDCNRMGMGKGYYDKTFAFKREARKPVLLGVAHECQRVDRLETAWWDVPLDGIMTPDSFYEGLR